MQQISLPLSDIGLKLAETYLTSEGPQQSDINTVKRNYKRDRNWFKVKHSNHDTVRIDLLATNKDNIVFFEKTERWNIS